MYKAAPCHRQYLFLKKFRQHRAGHTAFCDNMFPLEDSEPSFFQDAVCTDAEFTCGAHHIDGCVFHLAGRHERFKHPADNERINQLFLPAQFTGLYTCDDDGMMLYGVLCPNDVLRRGKVNHTGILSELLAGEHLLHDRRQRVIYIPWQQATGGARIGNQPLLVQALCNLLHLYGRQAVVTVRVFLQFGQVVKCRCPDVLRPFRLPL